jgi:N-methylhydantoinase A
VDVARLARAAGALEERAVADLRRTADVEAPTVVRSADMRYAGQNYELEVPLPDGDLEAGWPELLARFEAEHERQFGFRLEGEPVELINLRVTAVRREEPPALAAPAAGHVPDPAAIRPVFFDADEPAACPIYRRDALPAGARLVGPAIVEELDSTTLVCPGDLLDVHPSGALVLTIP